MYHELVTQALAAVAMVASAINIGGGFTITQRMLDMFKRPTDPTEYNYLYAIPGAALLAGYFGGKHVAMPINDCFGELVSHQLSWSLTRLCS